MQEPGQILVHFYLLKTEERDSPGCARVMAEGFPSCLLTSGPPALGDWLAASRYAPRPHKMALWRADRVAGNELLNASECDDQKLCGRTSLDLLPFRCLCSKKPDHIGFKYLENASPSRV